MLSAKNALIEGIVYLKSSSSSYHLDSEILLSEVLKKPREYLVAHPEEELTEKQARQYRLFLTRRYEGEPVPYIIGHKEFYGREFIVNKYVLIPRPETEAIVEECVKICDSAFVRSLPSSPAPVIADIGTGSGVIAVTLALEIRKARIVATDKSGSALKVAQRNAKKHRVAKRVTFFASDLLNEIPMELSPSIIAANLPYVTSDELKHADENRDTKGLIFEPQGALDGGPDGMAVFRRFFAQLGRFRNQKETAQPLSRLRFLILEHNPKQKQLVRQMANDALPDFRPTEISKFVTGWEKITKEH